MDMNLLTFLVKESGRFPVFLCFQQCLTYFELHFYLYYE